MYHVNPCIQISWETPSHKLDEIHLKVVCSNQVLNLIEEWIRSCLQKSINEVSFLSNWRETTQACLNVLLKDIHNEAPNFQTSVLGVVRRIPVWKYQKSQVEEQDYE